jgi:hypothetical protein
MSIKVNSMNAKNTAKHIGTQLALFPGYEQEIFEQPSQSQAKDLTHNPDTTEIVVIIITSKAA